MKSVIHQGDNREVLKTLPRKHFHCCISSPPYFGLRSYLPKDSPLKSQEMGNEKSPEEYIAALVETFRELWKVMRDDGVVWLNLGDSYCASPPGNKTKGVSAKSGLNGVNDSSGKYRESLSIGHATKRDTSKLSGFKPKDLIGIPWRVAFALQSAGWYLRSGIPWVKRNCMPESVEDRPSSALEYVFLLTKSIDYYYDHEAVKVQSKTFDLSDRDRDATKLNNTPGRIKMGGLKNNNYPTRNHRNSDAFFDSWQGLYEENGEPLAFVVNPQGYKGAHFATFPKKLVQPMLLAGSSAGGCCENCGAPLLRQMEVGEPDIDHQQSCGSDILGNYDGEAVKDYGANGVQNASEVKRRILAGMRKKKTIGFEKQCECDAGIVPCRILDPFCGTATVGEVALEHCREFVGIDLNPEYAVLQAQRTCQPSLL